MKHNILGCVEPVAEFIQKLKKDGMLEHVDLVKTIPEFDLILEKRVRVSNNTVYVYPNGSQTLSQRGNHDSKQRIAVGITMAGKMNSTEAHSFISRIGEDMTELKLQIINFEPNNPRYKTRFFNQTLDTNDRHVFGDGFYFYGIRMLYETVLSNQN